MGPDDRATLYSSTEYKKIRLHYFTDDYAPGRPSIPESTSARAELYRAGAEGPARRGQLAGAGDAADRPRADLRRARRGLRAGRRRRQPLRRLGRLLGAADPRPRRPRRWSPRSTRPPPAGPATAPRPRPRSSWPRRSPPAVPSVEMVRMTSSGTEAAMSAVRLARAVTGREVVVKFAGAYHGHSDGLLAEAGSGLATLGDPGQPRRHRRPGRGDGRRSLERPRGGRRAPSPSTRSPPCSPSRSPPTWASSRPPRASSSSSARRPARAGALLVFDEVITGFRVARGGAQELYGVDPDLTVLGKVLGGGLPGGRLRRPARDDGADRPGRRRLPGGHALRQPARGRRRPGDPAPPRRRRLRAARRADRPPRRRPRATLAADRPLQVAAAPGLRHPLLQRRAGRPTSPPPRPATSRPTPASAARCSSAASTRRPRSSRPGSSPSPTTRRRSTAPSRPPPSRSTRCLAMSPADSLQLLAAQLREEDTPISPHVVDPRRARSDAGRGRPRRRAPGEYALVVEAVREGYLLHYGEPRLLAGHDADLAAARRRLPLRARHRAPRGARRLRRGARARRPDRRLRPAPRRGPRGRGARALALRRPTRPCRRRRRAPESIDSVAPELELWLTKRTSRTGPRRPAAGAGEARPSRLLRGRVDDSPSRLHDRRPGPRRPRRRRDRPARRRLRRRARSSTAARSAGRRSARSATSSRTPTARSSSPRPRGSATPARPPPTCARAPSSSARTRTRSSPSPTAASTSAARSASSRPPATSSAPATAASTTSRASGIGGPPVRPLDQFQTRIRNGQVEVGPRYSVTSQLEPVRARDPGEFTGGIWEYLYPPRPSTFPPP